MKFYVIGDEDTVLGFQLAGVDGIVVSDALEAKQAVEEAFRREDLGVIIIPERIASKIQGLVNQYLYKTTFPLIIEIPDRLGPLEGRKSVRDLLRAAVGVHL